MHAVLTAAHGYSADTMTLAPGVPVREVEQAVQAQLESDGPAEEMRRTQQIVSALLTPTSTVSWRCDAAEEKARTTKEHPVPLLEVRDKHLVIAEMSRGAQQPSGWRPRGYWLADLRMLKEEGFEGIWVECAVCSKTHLLSRRELKERRDRRARAKVARTGEGPTPDGFGGIEETAFGELWGEHDSVALSEDRPALYAYLTGIREARFRAEHEGDPVAAQLLLLVASRVIRADSFGDGSIQSLYAGRMPDHGSDRVGEQVLRPSE